jgi:hypothetical protein
MANYPYVYGGCFLNKHQLVALLAREGDVGFLGIISLKSRTTKVFVSRLTHSLYSTLSMTGT